MTRFPLLDGPRSYPHRDIVLSDTRQENPVFDLGIDLDSYDGAVYIQVDHIKEMARSIGMLTKEEANELREENRRLKAQVDALPEKAQELTDGMADLVTKFRSDLIGIANSEPTDSSVEVVQEPDGLDRESILEFLDDSDGPNENSESSDEHSGGERPASVRNDGESGSTERVFGL